jgi:hypothetical protein
VGEDLARARLAGGDRLPRQGRPDAGARGGRLPHGRLRLHDLHRQLGPAAGPDPDAIKTATSRGGPCCRATATSKAASARRREGQLPRVAAAGRGVRARRARRHRPEREPLGTGARRPAGVPARHLAEPAEIADAIARASRRAVPRATQRLPGPPEWQAITAKGRALRRGRPKSTYIQEPPFFVDMTPGRRRRSQPISARALLASRSATR